MMILKDAVRPLLLVLTCTLWYGFGLADGRELRWWALVWAVFATLMTLAVVLLFVGDRQQKRGMRELIAAQRESLEQFRRREELMAAGIVPVGKIKPIDRTPKRKPDLRVVGETPPAIPITRGETDEQDRPG